MTTLCVRTRLSYVRQRGSFRMLIAVACGMWRTMWVANKNIEIRLHTHAPCAVIAPFSS